VEGRASCEEFSLDCFSSSLPSPHLSSSSPLLNFLTPSSFLYAQHNQSRTSSPLNKNFMFSLELFYSTGRNPHHRSFLPYRLFLTVPVGNARTCWQHGTRKCWKFFSYKISFILAFALLFFSFLRLSHDISRLLNRFNTNSSRSLEPSPFTPQNPSVGRCLH